VTSKAPDLQELILRRDCALMDSRRVGLADLQVLRAGILLIGAFAGVVGIPSVDGKNQELAETEDQHQIHPAVAGEQPEIADDGLFETQVSSEEVAKTFSAQFAAEAPKHILSDDLPASASTHSHPFGS